MNELQDLIDNNERWAAAIKEEDPEFFAKLARQQTPEFLWIGCSDARVPANEIVGMLPGDLFVHRNVANVVLHTDLNCLSVIQYAVDDRQFGLIDGWLRTIRDLYYENRELLAKLPTEEEQVDRLCELNVIQQVANVGGQRGSYQHRSERLASGSEAVGSRLHLRDQGWTLEKSEYDDQRPGAAAAAVSVASAGGVIERASTEVKALERGLLHLGQRLLQLLDLAGHFTRAAFRCRLRCGIIRRLLPHTGLPARCAQVLAHDFQARLISLGLITAVIVFVCRIPDVAGMIRAQHGDALPADRAYIGQAQHWNADVVLLLEPCPHRSAERYHRQRRARSGKFPISIELARPGIGQIPRGQQSVERLVVTVRHTADRGMHNVIVVMHSNLGGGVTITLHTLRQVMLDGLLQRPVAKADDVAIVGVGKQACDAFLAPQVDVDVGLSDEAQRQGGEGDAQCSGVFHAHVLVGVVTQPCGWCFDDETLAQDWEWAEWLVMKYFQRRVSRTRRAGATPGNRQTRRAMALALESTSQHEPLNHGVQVRRQHR
nr:hypothetical protein [Tanacetum cinerariifolium]